MPLIVLTVSVVRPRSMSDNRQTIKLLGWLAHPHKDDTTDYGETDNLLHIKSDRTSILAMRILISELVKLGRDRFKFDVSDEPPCACSLWLLQICVLDWCFTAPRGGNRCNATQLKASCKRFVDVTDSFFSEGECYSFSTYGCVNVQCI